MRAYTGATGSIKSAIVKERVDGYGVGSIHILNDATQDDSNADLSDTKLTILSDGNVGIGTTSPGQKLTIRATDTAGSTGLGATLQLQSDAAATANKGGSIIFSDTGSATRAAIKGMFTGPSSGGSLVFSTGSSGNILTEQMRIDSDGNVGIGTTSPNSKLNIVGATNSTTGFIVNANVGITGNYSVGNCWMAYSGGINYGTNCSAI